MQKTQHHMNTQPQKSNNKRNQTQKTQSHIPLQRRPGDMNGACEDSTSDEQVHFDYWIEKWQWKMGRDLRVFKRLSGVGFGIFLFHFFSPMQHGLPRGI